VLRRPQHHYAFSPDAWFVLALWVAQTLVQVYFVRNLFIYDEADVARIEALPYAPLFAAGNLFQGSPGRFSAHTPTR
jgi:hypothetical protein